MPSPNYMSTMILLVDVNGTKQEVEFTVKDAEARQLINALGNAVKWLGVTTTELVDNVTTSADITIDGQTVTATEGGMAQYNGEEFVYNGTKWQSIGKNNFGNMAFADTASASYTPSGTVAISAGTDTTDNVTGVTDVGALPYFTQNGEAVTFHPGTLPTADTQKTFVTQRGTDTAAFTGTAATIQVTPDSAS